MDIGPGLPGPLMAQRGGREIWPKPVYPGSSPLPQSIPLSSHLFGLGGRMERPTKDQNEDASVQCGDQETASSQIWSP